MAKIKHNHPPVIITLNDKDRELHSEKKLSTVYAVKVCWINAYKLTARIAKQCLFTPPPYDKTTIYQSTKDILVNISADEIIFKTIKKRVKGVTSDWCVGDREHYDFIKEFKIVKGLTNQAIDRIFLLPEFAKLD